MSWTFEWMNEWMCEHQSSIWCRLRATSVREHRLIHVDADADPRSYKLDTRWRHRATSVREHRGLGGRPVTHLPMWALVIIIIIVKIMIMTTMIMMMFTMIVMEMKKRSGRYSSTHNGENLMSPIIMFPDKMFTSASVREYLWSWKFGLTSSMQPWWR